MSLPTVQFPLCGLAYGDDTKNRVLTCLAYGIVSAGRMQLRRLSSDQADEIIAKAPEWKAARSFPKQDLRILKLGHAFTGAGFEHAEWPWKAAGQLEAFLTQWKAEGRTAPIARIPSPIAIEAGWHHGDYKFFAALCALNAAIGSKPYAIVTRSRVRAGMLGYSSGRLLFDERGELTDAGRALMASRQDGVSAPATDNQVRTLLDKLVARGLAQRFHPFNGSLSYYSKFLAPEEIAQKLIARAERTTHNPKLIELGQRLRAVKSGLFSGDVPLSGDRPPHNEEAPHNEKTTAQAPPDHRPVTAQAPHNASVLCSCLNASPNASHTMSANRECALEDAQKKTPEQLLAELRAAVP